jgi:recombination protein RecT
MEKRNTPQKKTGIQYYMSQPNVQKRFEDILGKKAAGFMSSVINTVNSNTQLQKCDPQTVLKSAAVAASLDLPVDKNLGFSWIIPYGNEASFQMGYKGYIQLALRSGEYARLNAVPVHENQFKHYNALTEELDADFAIDGEGEVVGYAFYFRLINGFEKQAYWSTDKVTKHAKRFSQAYKGKRSSPWETDFDQMALKTVIKNTLAKWGILSIEMQSAIQHDQGVIDKEDNITYPDGVEFEDLAEEVEADKADDFDQDSEPETEREKENKLFDDK